MVAFFDVSFVQQPFFLFKAIPPFFPFCIQICKPRSELHAHLIKSEGNMYAELRACLFRSVQKHQPGNATSEFPLKNHVSNLHSHALSTSQSERALYNQVRIPECKEIKFKNPTHENGPFSVLLQVILLNVNGSYVYFSAFFATDKGQQ